VGTLASPWLEGADSWDQDEGDASVPTPRLIHPRPYDKTGFLPP